MTEVPAPPRPGEPATAGPLGADASASTTGAATMAASTSGTAGAGRRVVTGLVLPAGALALVVLALT